MEQTERTPQSPGEERAPFSEAGMQERNAHYLSLETLGLHPIQEATVGDRGGREGGAVGSSYLSLELETSSSSEQKAGLQKRERLGGLDSAALHQTLWCCEDRGTASKIVLGHNVKSLLYNYSYMPYANLAKLDFCRFCCLIC